MKIELDSLSLKDLKDLKKRVERKISDFEDRKKREALAAVEEKAKAMGFSLSELVGASAVKKRRPAKPKYANPSNKAETWTGRGRKPRWVEAALKSGKTLEDLAI